MSNLGEGLVERTAKETTEKVNDKYIVNMRKNGLSIEQIAEIAEMSVDSIKKIIEKCQHNKSLTVEE